ncbi:MAG: efflux RND transporter permease subunit [Terrimicrobiaceae bacterium]|nr:efflux RND transporter permease subunit [Terrimicrobiaceae bacterium]
MTFTDIFVKRPVLAVVVSVVIIVAGLQAIGTLSVRQYPKLERATILLRTIYVGADAELVRGFITTPLERAISAAGGIDYIESTSSMGMSEIRVILRLNQDPVSALSDISSKVDQVRGDLPPGAEVPALTIEPADAQVAAMYLSFRSDILQPNQVNDYLLRVVQPRLSAVPGVQKADILGGQTYALRIWLKADRLAALGLAPSDIRNALEANNYLSAIGQTKGQLMQFNLTANTDLRNVEEFRKLVLAERNGAVVRLEDVADVELGAETYDATVRFSGEDAVFMGIWVMPTANTLEVIQAARVELEAIKASLPSGLQAAVAYDSTTYIEEAIHEVEKTLFETILVVLVVIYLFIGSLRAALVPMVTIPVSLIGAIFLMQVFGFTINLLTLLAIVLSVGLVVDDAIVVLENIERHIAEGMKPFDAAIRGARELIGPVISMTITLAAVYVPIGFQGGVTGALFREFAFTLAGAVFISGIVALTLSPVMCSKLIRPEVTHRGFAKRVSGIFDRLRHTYGVWVDRTLDNRPAVYVVWVVLSLAAIGFYMMSPTELAPKEDQGIIFGAISPPANATLEQVTYYTERAYDVFAAVPEKEHTFQIVQPAMGFGGMLVKPWSERNRSIFEIEPEVTMALMGITGVQHPAFLPDPLPAAGLFPVEFVILGTLEPDKLLELAQEVVGKAMASGQFAFLETDVKIDQSREEIIINRDKVATLGLDMRSVGEDLGSLLGGGYVNRFNYDGRSYKVIPQIQRAQRLTPEQLELIQIRGPGETLLPLSAVAEVQSSVEPRSLNRFNQLNSVKIQGVAPQSLSAGLEALEKAAEEVLPKGVNIAFAGQSRQLKEEAGKFLPAFMLAVLLIYLVLAAQFNSFRDPFIILLGSVPLAMFGALIFTFLKDAGPPGWIFRPTQGWTTTLNIYSQVGLVTLVGLIAKHGILIVEFANVLRRQGASKLDAIRESARLRLRPILMTTAATVFGHIMLIFVTGPGAEARNSIGLVLVLGMTIGTVFTLFILPSIYMLIAPKEIKVDPDPAPLTSEPAPSH